jgi:hypothetical protein
MIRNYQYHVAEIVTGLADIEAELERARVFWNTLVGLDRDHQSALWAAARTASPELESACQTRDGLTAAYLTLRDARRMSRSGGGTDAGDAEVKAALSALREAQTQARRLFLTWRKEASCVKEMNAKFIQALNDARRRSALGFGTYNAVRKAFDIALSKRYKPGQRPTQIRRKEEHERNGTLTVQITAGGCAAENMAGCRPCRIEGDIVTMHVGTEGFGDLRTRGKLIRFDRYEQRFATLRVKFHRPLPAGAQVKEAKLTRDGKRYSLTFTLVLPDAPARPVPTRFVGVDLGWREREDGRLRAALAATSSDEHLEITLSADLRLRHERLNALEGEIDTLRDKVWTQFHADNTLPEPVAKLLGKQRAQWCDPDALADAMLACKDMVMPDDLWAWRKAHRALRNEAEGLRRRLRSQRREAYRLAALALVREADVIGVEDCDLRDMALNKARDDGAKNELAPRARANRVIVGAGELRHWIRSTGEREGVEVFDVPASYTSVTCSACGDTAIDLTPQLHVLCKTCGAVHDQDENAATNIRERCIAAVMGGEGSRRSKIAEKQSTSRTSMRALHDRRAKQK